MQKEINNSYLSLNELIYHAVTIAFGVALIEIMFGYYDVFTRDTTSWSESSIGFFYFYPLLKALGIVLYAIPAAFVTYPFYKKWAQKKGGLTIVLNSVNNDKTNT